MCELTHSFNNKITKIFLGEKLPKKLAVAVSGGVDSLALTILLGEFCLQENIELFALTVDHKMRESSSKEALALSKVLGKNKISHHILEIDQKKLPQRNIESSLREIRYELLGDFCKKQKISHLFLGHQLGDVAENFLIRLFRGSGLDGLSTIAEILEVNKIKLVRPLLDFDKSDLENFLRAKKIKWFEDESNLDEKFLRNKIRNFFATFDEKNLIQKRIKNATDEIAKMRDFFDEIMLKEAKKILKFHDKKYFLINHKKLQKLDEKFALKILALVAMEISQKNYKPRLKDLKKFYEYLLKNKIIKPRNFYGCEISQYDANYLILRSQEPKKIDKNLNDEFYFRTVLGKIFTN
ncbi:MAG: tRNA lysidine(34) synthetase TilS [Rickettsiales bacterium]|nr:tRNA lysidine(34) synthetase TilS [Rickettsiales bacterium]